MSSHGGTVFVAADPVLDLFYELVFRCYVRRHKGEGEMPPAEVPSALMPFMQFKPRRAVREPQVRSALLTVLDKDPQLRAMCLAEVHAGPPKPATAWAVLKGSDDRLTAQVAAAAALHQAADWEAVLWVAAAGIAGHVRGVADEAQRSQRVLEERGRRDARAIEKSEKARDRAIAAEAKARRDADVAREQRNELRSQVESLRLEREQAAEVAERARAELEHQQERVAAFQASLDDLELRRREATGDFDRERSELQSRIRLLESMRVPDLEGPAEAIEAIAAQLRCLQERISGNGGVAAHGSATEAIGTKAPTGSARQSGRTPPKFPTGMHPQSAEALRWAFARRDLVVLVDGYNVTRQEGRGWGDLSGEDQRRLLVARAEQLVPAAGAEIRIVFDAAQPDTFRGRRHHRRVRPEFSGGISADDRLVEIANELPITAEVVAITSDRELQGRLRQCGVAPFPSTVFLDVAGAPLR